MSIKLSPISLLLAFFLSACTVQVGPKAEEKVANTGTQAQQEAVQAAAKAVAVRFDAGQYGEAWDSAGSVLTAKTNREEFVRYVATLRRPLGKAGSRKVKGFGFPNEIDGAPPGAYGLIAVNTDFANAKGVEEKFVFELVGGEWKLIGYWLSKKITIGAADLPNHSFKPKPLRGMA